MPLFRRTSPADRQAAAANAERDAASQAALEAGGLPLRAQERLARQRAQGGVWTGDLSVGELAALHRTGFEPVGQVMGSSLYRVSTFAGQGPGVWGGGLGGFGGGIGSLAPQENTMLTEALAAARARAMSRLVQETVGLEAHGVVGVRVRMRAYEWGANLLEFTAIGTAVRHPAEPPLPRPFTSDLSGQEFGKLVAVGWMPVGLVFGASAVQSVAMFGVGPGMSGWAAGGVAVNSWANQEVGSFTQGQRLAQRRARERLLADARRQGAHGVVGVGITRRVMEFPTGSESVQGRLLEWVVVGTGVVAVTAAHRAQRPAMVVPLRRPGERPERGPARP